MIVSNNARQIKAVNDKIGANTDLASMTSTLFAGQQRIDDDVGTVNTKVGANTDSASMAGSMFAGQQYISDFIPKQHTVTYHIYPTATEIGINFNPCPNRTVTVLSAYFRAFGYVTIPNDPTGTYQARVDIGVGSGETDNVANNVVVNTCEHFYQGAVFMSSNNQGCIFVNANSVITTADDDIRVYWIDQSDAPTEGDCKVTCVELVITYEVS